jgi:predicted nucleotidyltransferase
MNDANSFISDHIRQKIVQNLMTIEDDFDVNILLAIESGSRAWGFPSLDSDYDVRFIYNRPIQQYLTVFEDKDVIEVPIDDSLDISGWGLRKTLGLIVKSNAVVLEWLSSPIQYHRATATHQKLYDLARSSADLTKLAYHHDHLARPKYEEVCNSDDKVRLKTYFYALRSILSLDWIRRFQEPPPMDLPALMVGLDLPSSLRDPILDLKAIKAAADETKTSKRVFAIDQYIEKHLESKVKRHFIEDRETVTKQANDLFAASLLRPS